MTFFSGLRYVFDPTLRFLPLPAIEGDGGIQAPRRSHGVPPASGVGVERARRAIRNARRRNLAEEEALARQSMDTERFSPLPGSSAMYVPRSERAPGTVLQDMPVVSRRGRPLVTVSVDQDESGTLLPRDHSNALRGQDVRGTLAFEDEIPESMPNPLTEEQRQAWDTFIAINPRPDTRQLVQFFEGIGIPSRQVNISELAEASRLGWAQQPASEAIMGVPDISDRRGEGGVGEGLDAFGRGVADTGSFGLADEFAARMNSFLGNGTYLENLARERAVDQYDTENHRWPRLAGQVVAGGALPSRVGAVLRASGRVKAANQLAREGAFFGGAYGFGSSNGDIADRVGDALVGATAGSVTGAAIGHGMGPLTKAPATSRDARRLYPRREGPVNEREYQRQLARGTPPEVAQHLARPYPEWAQGGHLVPQRVIRDLEIPRFIGDSSFNVMRRRTRGETYDAHALSDPHVHHFTLPRRMSWRVWPASEARDRRPTAFDILWHGTPRPLKFLVGGVGAGAYLAEQEE